MDAKKFQIFVSSTYSDLVDVRRGLMDAIQRLNHFPVGMEQFSADDDEQWQIIRETLEQTDYYVCIIGHRYGSLTADGRSFTEKEWDLAKELGIPIMSFIRERNTATTPQERESSAEQIKRLDKFIEKVKAGKMVDFWTDPNDLNQKAITALIKAFSRKPRPGWMRSQSTQVAEQLATLVDENRSLRNQVEKLTSEVKHTKPSFEILLNGSPSLSLKFVDDTYLRLTEVPYLPQVEWSSVPAELKSYLTEEEVEEYNGAVPDAAEIERKVAEVRRIERTKLSAIVFDITIRNVGSAKGRQVYVDLKFPGEVVLLEKDELDDLKFPKLDLPKNPIDKAKKAKAKAEAGPFGYGIRDPLAGMFSELSLRHNLASSLVARRRSLRVEGNKVTIWMEDLMHTREFAFSEAVIAALKEGSFMIEATLICEEFEVPQSFKLPLSITSGTPADLPSSFLGQITK